jgi:hypothetical protein
MNLLHKTLWLGCLALPALAQAQAHQHGVLTLDIAIEARMLTLQMESPLDNLVGFERGPRNDAERKRVDAMVARLEAAQALFTIDPAAQCTLANVELNSAVLKIGPAQGARGATHDEHADIDARIEFACQEAARAAFIDVGLFEAFAGMKRIDVQVATPKGQFKRTLKRPARRISLTR